MHSLFSSRWFAETRVANGRSSFTLVFGVCRSLSFRHWHRGPSALSWRNPTPVSTPPQNQQRSQGKQAQAAASGPKLPRLSDSYVPIFSGQPASYKEWRQSAVNIVGSFSGVTWRPFREWLAESLEKGDVSTPSSPALRTT